MFWFYNYSNIIKNFKFPIQERLVSSLGWLSLDASQASDLLSQANAVIRRLLASGQVEHAAAAVAKIPKETLGRVVRTWREGGEGEAEDDMLPKGDVREFLAHKVNIFEGLKKRS